MSAPAKARYMNEPDPEPRLLTPQELKARTLKRRRRAEGIKDQNANKSRT